MPVRVARREFLSRLGAMAAASITASPLGYALMKPESLSRPTRSHGDQQQKSSNAVEAKPLTSPFRVSVINDEISQDFGRACEVASREFGMECRTGNHAKKFVTNRFGQTHDVARLYVCDSSVFLNCTEKTT